MNKNLLKRIASVATELDQFGFTREAKSLDLILLKLAQEEMEGFKMDDSGDDEYPDAPRTYGEAYFRKYPDAPRTYEEGYFRKYPDAPRTKKMKGFEMDYSGDGEYAKAYFQKYPDAPRTYGEAYFQKYPDAPRGSYKKKRDNFVIPPVNTPPVNTPPANTKQTDDFQSMESARQLAIKMLADKIPGLEKYPRKLQDKMLQGYAEKNQGETNE